MEVKKNTPGKEEALMRLREKFNLQHLWNKYKADTMKASETCTQTHCKERTRTQKEAEKEIKKAENLLEGSTPEEEEDHRKTLSERKRSLNEHEEEARE